MARRKGSMGDAFVDGDNGRKSAPYGGCPPLLQSLQQQRHHQGGAFSETSLSPQSYMAAAVLQATPPPGGYWGGSAESMLPGLMAPYDINSDSAAAAAPTLHQQLPSSTLETLELAQQDNLIHMLASPATQISLFGSTTGAAPPFEQQHPHHHQNQPLLAALSGSTASTTGLPSRDALDEYYRAIFSDTTAGTHFHTAGENGRLSQSAVDMCNYTYTSLTDDVPFGSGGGLLREQSSGADYRLMQQQQPFANGGGTTSQQTLLLSPPPAAPRGARQRKAPGPAASGGGFAPNDGIQHRQTQSAPANRVIERCPPTVEPPLELSDAPTLIYQRPDIQVWSYTQQQRSHETESADEDAGASRAQSNNNKPVQTADDSATTKSNEQHPFGCKPCAFKWTKGCTNGDNCPFCHEWHAPRKKKPMKDQKNLMIIARRDGKIEFLRCSLAEALLQS